MASMHATLRTGLAFGLAAVIAACSGGGGDGGAAPIVAEADCTADNANCPALAIAGDPPATLADGGASPVAGYADASLRQAGGGGLWLGYSWLHADVSRLGAIRGALVDTHLARSDDGGRSWRFVAALWQATTGVRDAYGRSGHLNSEALSLARRATPTGSHWYAARFVYFTPDNGSPAVSSFTLRLSAAASPDQLGGAEEAVLGGALSDAYWGVDLNLAALSGELSGCSFYDAGLIYRGDKLYLAVQCARYDASGELPDDEFIALFATVPDGAPREWTWTYLGKLASSADAAALVPQARMLQQAELALARDGRPLLIVSPSAPADEGAVLTQHYGCYALEVATLEPPRLVRDAAGRPGVRAFATATDLAASEGSPASCTYDAASETGIVLARRDQRGGLKSSLNATGLRP
jgi:hypothetical protein